MAAVLPDLEAVSRRLPSGYVAREFRDKDREPLTEERNAEVHPVQRGSPEEWRRWERIMPNPGELRLVVDAPDGGVVAMANVSTGGPFAAPDGSARGGIGVARSRRRKGIGSALLVVIEEDARRRGSPRLIGGVSADQPFALEWATKRGYVEIGRRIESFVDLEKFDPARWDEQRRRPLQQGIRFATIAELMAGRDEAGREELYRRLWEAGREPFEDVPVAAPMGYWPYEAFRRVYDSPGAAPDLDVLALDDDRIVGMTTSYRRESNAGGTGFTGVARAYRGRGIAFALKAEVLSRAKAAGLRSMITTNDEPNKAMRGINYTLGYEMLPARIQLEKRFV